MRSVLLPKGVEVQVMFDAEGYNHDATMAAFAKVAEKFEAELRNDQETVKGLITEIRTEHGKDGVMCSHLPAGPLYAALHNKLGSLAVDAPNGLFARNEVKIDAVLDEIAISSGKSGLRFATTDEIKARKDMKAAKKRIRDARKAEEKRVLEAYRASKGATV